MTRSRSLLHLNKVQEFANWMSTKGWGQRAPKGTYEVLRMVHRNSSEPLIVYKRLKAEHCTVYGNGLHFVHRWLKERKENENG